MSNPCFYILSSEFPILYRPTLIQSYNSKDNMYM